MWLKMEDQEEDNEETIVKEPLGKLKLVAIFCYKSIVCVSRQLDSSGLPFPECKCFQSAVRTFIILNQIFREILDTSLNGKTCSTSR